MRFHGDVSRLHTNSEKRCRCPSSGFQPESLRYQMLSPQESLPPCDMKCFWFRVDAFVSESEGSLRAIGRPVTQTVSARQAVRSNGGAPSYLKWSFTLETKK